MKLRTKPAGDCIQTAFSENKPHVGDEQMDDATLVALCII